MMPPIRPRQTERSVHACALTSMMTRSTSTKHKAAPSRGLAPLRKIDWVVYAKRPFGGCLGA
jgi:hypothetical protein